MSDSWWELRLEKEAGASQLMGEGVPCQLGSMGFVCLWGNGGIVRDFRQG